MDDPIQSSIQYLIETGWTEDQAKNLIKAINDPSAERLWEIAPKWIEHCGESKFYVAGMLDSVAMGLVSVSMNEEGEWIFALNDKGLGVGKTLQGGM